MRTYSVRIARQGKRKEKNMIGTVISGGVHGMEAFIVRVECDISDGFPGFDFVGMLSSEVKEARERTITALGNLNISVPPKKVTVNMAPADVRKHGTGYDLPIAISILTAMGVIRQESVANTLFIGELMLSGELNKVRGVLPVVKLAKEKGISVCVVPEGNAREASVIEGMRVISVNDIRRLIDILNGESKPAYQTVHGLDIDDGKNGKSRTDNNFSRVSGQKVAKRGLEIAAAGMHNVLMVGPPGTGKTMLAKCLPGILPPMTTEEAIEVSSVYSVAGMLTEENPLITERPVIEAHHTSTEISLCGGGNIPKPGLVTLAHRGVLFLDEMPEFSRKVLEVLRQPLEDKVINVARNGYDVRYPAQFMLVGAMNPCPCGMYPDMNKCTCTETMRKKYSSKLSKPLLDRIDLCLQVLRPGSEELMSKTEEENSETVRTRVMAAHEIQKERYKGKAYFNSQMGVEEIEKYCALNTEERKLMERAISKYELSARAYHRVLRTARTIADLDGSEVLNVRHISEALFYKSNGDF